jgi:hypothetical protein
MESCNNLGYKMPGAVRPNSKAAKLAYALLKTPKDLQTRSEPRPPEKKIREWFRDSSTCV